MKIQFDSERLSQPEGAAVAKIALRFVLIFGIVNFFADMTYEGARSITGPFLSSLGASAAVVGFVAGFGEMVGFGLRSVTGYFADKTHRYWTVTFIGYAINMLAVPALALAGNWPVAAALMITERTGRAIRKPAVDSMLSHAGSVIGHGWVFGLNEALDQTGATLGPLMAASILYRHGGDRRAFATLLISAVLCLAVLTVAWHFYRRPQELEKVSAKPLSAEGFSQRYWLYLAAGALVAAGFADFSLIAFHFQKNATVPHDIIPVLYAVAMAAAAIGSLVIGKLFDRFGIAIVMVGIAIASLFAPLAFLGGPILAFVGMGLWGIGMGVQDSTFKAMLSGTVQAQKRSTSFGIFDTGFGIAWFVGSAAMGLLYRVSIPALIGFSMTVQLLALPFFYMAHKTK